jgi:hypothetical protein
MGSGLKKAMVAGTLLGVSTISAIPSDQASGAETTSNQYDALGRLNQTYRLGGPTDGNLTQTQFDAADNRLQYSLSNVLHTLNAGDSIYSADGRTRLFMQTDNAMVVYFLSSPLWGTGTAGSGATVAKFQGDGNFVLYASAGTPIWQSGTGGQPASQLAVQNDGNVVIYNRNGSAIWSTGTGGHQ